MAVINISPTLSFHRVRRDILQMCQEAFNVAKPEILEPIEHLLNRYDERTHPTVISFEDQQKKTRKDIPSPSALFLPAGMDAQTGQRSYTVIRHDGRGHLLAREYPYIPSAVSFLKESYHRSLQKSGRLKAVFDGIDLEKRMSSMVEHKAWENQRDLLYGRRASDVRNLDIIFHANKLDNNARNYCSRNAAMIASMMNIVIHSPEVLTDLSDFLQEKTDLREIDKWIDVKSQKIRKKAEGDFERTDRLSNDIFITLTDYEIKIREPLIAEFKADLSSGVLELLENTPNQRTTGLYNAMLPVRDVVEYVADDWGRQKKKINPFTVALDEKLASERSVAVREFPIIASLTKSLEIIRKGSGQPENYMKEVLGARSDKRMLDILRGKSEHDIPGDIAASLQGWVGYLRYIEKDENIPKTSLDWRGFNITTKLDQALYRYRMISKSGDYVREVLQKLDEGKDWPGTHECLGIKQVGDISKVVGNVRDVQNFIARGGIVPSILRWVEDWDKQNLFSEFFDAKDQSQWMDLARVDHQDARKRLSSNQKKMLQATNGVGFAGLVFNEYPFEDWVACARSFSECNNEVMQWRRDLALTRHRLRRGAEAKFPTLPEISDNEQAMEEDMLLSVLPVEDAARLSEVCEELEVFASKAASEIVSDRALYVRVYHPEKANELVGITMLYQVNKPGDPLKLERRADRTWGKYGATPDHNSYEPSIDAAIRIWERKVEKPKFLDEARHKLSSDSQKNADIADLIGHDPKNPKQNRQFIEHIQDALPKDLKRDLLENEEHNLSNGSMTPSILRTAVPIMAHHARVLTEDLDTILHRPQTQADNLIAQL